MNVQFKSTRQGEWGKEARCCSGSGVRNEGDEGPGINADLAQMKDTECHPLEVTVMTNEKPEHNDYWPIRGPESLITIGTIYMTDTWDLGLARLSGQFLTPGSRSPQCHWSHSRDITPAWPCLTRNTQRRSLCKFYISSSKSIVFPKSF